MRSSVLGTPIGMPILIAPTAFHGLAHPEGECATALAASQAGTLMAVSTSSSYSMEEIARSSYEPLWFQLYLHDRASAQELVQRAEAAGYRALVLTVDSPCWGRKERSIRCGFPNPSKGNFADRVIDDQHAHVTWDDLAWLRSLTTLPIVLKGILTAEDAALALQHHIDALIVSNHGGRQLDGVAASIEALPEVAEAVGGRCEVYMDGGIRRGTDVLKALALGAQAVLIGRPTLWGLAVNGSQGVYHMLQLLQKEFECAMMLSGRPTIASIDRSLVEIAPSK
jgi:isopentenyl diphosphate isomerase/L-lactate dehydrogenase-like FMN-dependent dehydrogenase